MQNTRKLRRYARKDYSQLVDFPVEIVGRDGVVRRYSFEESVRLYQHRISSAASRYDDGEIVVAEVRHCRMRIGQLRHSYFTRYGWSSIGVVDRTMGGMAGEVAAFLRRSLVGAGFEPELLEISPLDSGEYHEVYYIRNETLDGSSAPEPGSFLLYAYRLGEGDDDPARKAMADFLDVLCCVRDASCVLEHPVASHHTSDCGLVLTCSTLALAQQLSIRPPDVPHVELAWPLVGGLQDDGVREAMLMLRKGRRRDALRQFMRAYEQDHFRRAAYLGAIVVADQLGEHADAETAGLMGAHYFPEDASMHYHLALTRLRKGDVPAAQSALKRAETLFGPCYAFSVLGALIAFSSKDFSSGQRLLRASSEQETSHEIDVKRVEQWLRAKLSLRAAFRWTSAIMVVLGGAGLGIHLGVGMVLACLGTSLLFYGRWTWSHELSCKLTEPGSRGFRLANPACLRQSRTIMEDRRE
ncbi:MAG: hypothetical protein QGG40_15105 [Myxococcota bacterium]|nr:hypothetical protein [Myxococcota bacterium]